MFIHEHIIRFIIRMVMLIPSNEICASVSDPPTIIMWACKDDCKEWMFIVFVWNVFSWLTCFPSRK